LKRKVEETRTRLATRRKTEAEAADARADVLSLKSIYDTKVKADEEAAAAASAASASAAAYGTTRSKGDVKVSSLG
jgi:membrane protein involved in colicin uptake